MDCRYFCDVISDPRTKGWLLMSNPIPQIIIIAFYIYFVISLGPKIMENRKPFDLKRVLIVYNIFVVALSVYMCYEVIVILFSSRQTFCFCFAFGVYKDVFCYIPLSYAFCCFMNIICTLCGNGWTCCFMLFQACMIVCLA